MARRSINPQTVLLLAGLLMAAGALLPVRYMGWLGWFRGPVMTVVGPIATPLTLLAGWLRPGERSGARADLGADETLAQLEFYKSEYLASQQRIEQLEQVIEALQDDVPFGGRIRVKRVEATRIGSDPGSGTISVSRGGIHGVTLNTVAVAASAPYQLVGVVSNVGPAVSSVRIVTDRRMTPALIEVVLLPAAARADASFVAGAARAQLRPVGDGSVAGEIGVDDAAKLSRGDSAYLDDPSWPSSAQRLLLGRVTQIEDTDRPLFKRIVIRPDFDLSRVRSVVLRTPADEPVPGAGPGAGPGGDR